MIIQKFRPKIFGPKATIILVIVAALVGMVNLLYIEAIGSTQAEQEVIFFKIIFYLKPLGNPDLIWGNILGVFLIGSVIIASLENRMNLSSISRKKEFDFALISGILLAFMIGILAPSLLFGSVKAILMLKLIIGISFSLGIGLFFRLKGTLERGDAILRLGSGILPAIAFSMTYGIIILINNGLFHGFILGLAISGAVYVLMGLYQIIEKIKLWKNSI